MISFLKACGAGALGLLALAAAPSHAGVIVGASSYSTDMGSLSASYTIANAFNQSRLSATYTSGTTDFDTFVASTTSNNQASPAGIFQAASNVKSGDIQVDLGTSMWIDKIALWNAANASSFRVTQLAVYAATSMSDTVGTLLGSFSPTGGGSTPTAAQAQVFDFTATDVRYLRIHVANAGGPQVVFNELAFDKTTAPAAAVPEPSSLACLAVAGLGMAFTSRRRKLRDRG